MKLLVKYLSKLAHKSYIVRLESNGVIFNNVIMPETVTVGASTYTIQENWKQVTKQR